MAPLHALAECLALIEHYGYLRRLVIAYLGPIENPMLHTYIHLYPKIGLHFRYFAHEQVGELCASFDSHYYCALTYGPLVIAECE